MLEMILNGSELWSRELIAHAMSNLREPKCSSSTSPATRIV